MGGGEEGREEEGGGEKKGGGGMSLEFKEFGFIGEIAREEEKEGREKDKWMSKEERSRENRTREIEERSECEK